MFNPFLFLKCGAFFRIFNHKKAGEFSPALWFLFSLMALRDLG